MFRAIFMFFLAFGATIVFAGQNGCKTPACKSTTTYYNSCNGVINKLFCQAGAVKCSIDRYRLDGDDKYYIDSYVIDYSEVKQKGLYDTAAFAKFCRKHLKHEVDFYDCGYRAVQTYVSVPQQTYTYTYNTTPQPAYTQPTYTYKAPQEQTRHYEPRPKEKYLSSMVGVYVGTYLQDYYHTCFLVDGTERCVWGRDERLKDEHVGRKFEVTYESKKEYIQEAGGLIDIDQLVKAKQLN